MFKCTEIPAITKAPSVIEHNGNTHLNTRPHATLKLLFHNAKYHRRRVKFRLGSGHNFRIIYKEIQIIVFLFKKESNHEKD